VWVSAVSRPPEVPRLFLPAVLVGAAVLRILWWVRYVEVLENEGAEFVRIAANWFHGQGYVSTVGGMNTIAPPLYPLLIGILAPVAGSEEAAARLVLLLAGLFFVWVMYRIALLVFGPSVAMIAALLAAAHPLLIALSVSSYSEGLYITVAAAASLLVVECMDRPTLGRAVFAGLCVTAAYLTRPEALVLAFLLGVVLLAVYWNRGTPVKGLRLASVLALTTLLLGAPYVIHLTRLAGSFRWEGKSSFNNLLSERTRKDGMSVEEAGRGLDAEGRPVGAFMFRDQTEVLRRPSGTLGSTVRGTLKDPLHRTYRVALQVSRSSALGGMPIVLLALVGVLCSGWWRGHKSEVAAILTVPILTLVALLTLDWTWFRYLIPLLPALLLFAAAGLGWIARRSRPLAAALGVTVLAVSGRGVARTFEISQTRDVDMRIAGEWIRDRHAELNSSRVRPLIMGVRVSPVHYAKGELVYLPWADEATSLRYIHTVQPDYVMLRESEARSAPFAAKWLRGELDDSCAEPVELPPGAEPYHVWRWTCTR